MVRYHNQFLQRLVLQILRTIEILRARSVHKIRKDPYKRTRRNTHSAPPDKTTFVLRSSGVIYRRLAAVGPIVKCSI
jgi:hypothetical protein